MLTTESAKTGRTRSCSRSWTWRSCAGAISLATLLLSLFQPANAQPALEADELIVHPEPKDPDFFRSRRDGWFWLNDPSVAKREKEKAQKDTAIVPPSESSRSAELKAHADLARAVDEALKVAYINPTEENLKRYLALWQLTVRKASVFSDLAQQAMWKNPQYDATVADGVRPTNPLAMNVFDEDKKEAQAATLRELSRDYGIWFFFDGSCGVCRIYAPLLKSFQMITRLLRARHLKRRLYAAAVRQYEARQRCWQATRGDRLPADLSRESKNPGCDSPRRRCHVVRAVGRSCHSDPQVPGFRNEAAHCAASSCPVPLGEQHASLLATHGHDGYRNDPCLVPACARRGPQHRDAADVQ